LKPDGTGRSAVIQQAARDVSCVRVYPAAKFNESLDAFLRLASDMKQWLTVMDIAKAIKIHLRSHRGGQQRWSGPFNQSELFWETHFPHRLI
jgi:hypothetical protein